MAVILGYTLVSVSSWFVFRLLGFIFWLALLVVPPAVLTYQGMPRRATLSLAVVLIASLEAWGFWYCDWEWRDCFYLVWLQVLWLAHASVCLAFLWVSSWLYAKFDSAVASAESVALASVDNDDPLLPPCWYALMQAMILAPWLLLRLVFSSVLLVTILVVDQVDRVWVSVRRFWARLYPSQPVYRHFLPVRPSLPKPACNAVVLHQEDDYPQVHPRQMSTFSSRPTSATPLPLPRGSLFGDLTVPKHEELKTDDSWPGCGMFELRMKILMDPSVDQETKRLVRESDPFLPPSVLDRIEAIISPAALPTPPLPAPITSTGIVPFLPAGGFSSPSVLHAPVEASG